MKNYKKILIPIYKAPLYFVWDCSSDDFVKTARDKFYIDLDKGNYYGAGFSTEFLDSKNNAVYILWVSDSRDVGLVAHEIFHLVCFIMDRRGISYSQENDEPFAYLIEYVTNRFLSYANPTRNPGTDGLCGIS